MFSRDLWAGAYARETFPKFVCPRCASGRLMPDSAGLFIQQPEYSKEESKHPGWEPDWDIERFSLRLKCDHTKCGVIAHVTGDTTIAQYYGQLLARAAIRDVQA